MRSKNKGVSVSQVGRVRRGWVGGRGPYISWLNNRPIDKIKRSAPNTVLGEHKDEEKLSRFSRMYVCLLEVP